MTKNITKQRFGLNFSSLHSFAKRFDRQTLRNVIYIIGQTSTVMTTGHWPVWQTKFTPILLDFWNFKSEIVRIIRMLVQEFALSSRGSTNGKHTLIRRIESVYF